MGGKGLHGCGNAWKGCCIDIAACLKGRRELASTPHHVKSNSDLIVRDNSQRNAGLLQSLVVAATVYPKELVDLIEVLLQLSQHIHYQVLFPDRQRGHIWAFYLHMQHTLTY